MFVSDYFELDAEGFDKMSEMGVFDARLDKDSHFFINIIRLKQSSIPEFVEAYQHINQFFSGIATLLDMADHPTMDDKMYRAARNKFHFHEVNGINLGFAASRYGAGWGEKTSDQCLQDAYQIVKKGSKQPEIFHLVSLFEENIAGDRLSDMIASIIEPEIKQYTLRIMQELGINHQTHPNMLFLPDGLIQNPYKNAPILLLPEEILHKLPIAKGWDDVDRVISENNAIRREISAEIGENWARWAASEKKRYLKWHIFMKPDVCNRVIDGYKSQDLQALDLKADPNYLSELFFKKIKKALSFKSETTPPTSLEAARAVMGIFKDWVENNRGWADIQDAPSQKREKAVQRFIHLGAKYYVEENNLDISCEANEGRGPVDIKFSRGQDKTLVEAKLSSNPQYLHGYQSQIKEYGLSERTPNLIYVFVDVGNPKRKDAIIATYRECRQSNKFCPELIIIDSRPKRAASTYDDNGVSGLDDLDFDFSNLKLESNFENVINPQKWSLDLTDWTGFFGD